MPKRLGPVLKVAQTLFQQVKLTLDLFLTVTLKIWPHGHGYQGLLCPNHKARMQFVKFIFVHNTPSH